ncbi:HAMP domain-containing protein [Dermabacteraceae bacterium P7074]
MSGTLVTGLTSLFLLQRTLLGTVDKDLYRSIDLIVDIANKSEKPMAAVNKHTIEGAFSPIDFIVEFHRENGTLEQRIYRGESDSNKLVTHLPDLPLSEVRKLDKQPFTVDVGDQRWRMIVAELPNASSPSSVYLAIPLKSLNSNMHTMGMAALITGSLVVLVGIGIGGMVTHRALSPLKDIEAAAGQIARGDLSKRVPVPPPPTRCTTSLPL